MNTNLCSTKELKKLLLQYGDLKRELAEKRERISALENQMQKSDKQPELSAARKTVLMESEARCLKQLCKIEQFIENIEESRIRRIFTYRYIEELNWIQIAMRVGGKFTTPDSIRMEHNRYFSRYKTNICSKCSEESC